MLSLGLAYRTLLQTIRLSSRTVSASSYHLPRCPRPPEHDKSTSELFSHSQIVIPDRRVFIHRYNSSGQKKIIQIVVPMALNFGSLDSDRSEWGLYCSVIEGQFHTWIPMKCIVKWEPYE